jgi:hypothetical protein
MSQIDPPSVDRRPSGLRIVFLVMAGALTSLLLYLPAFTPAQALLVGLTLAGLLCGGLPSPPQNCHFSEHFITLFLRS